MQRAKEVVVDNLKAKWMNAHFLLDFHLIYFLNISTKKSCWKSNSKAKIEYNKRTAAVRIEFCQLEKKFQALTFEMVFLKKQKFIAEGS